MRTYKGAEILGTPQLEEYSIFVHLRLSFHQRTRLCLWFELVQRCS